MSTASPLRPGTETKVPAVLARDATGSNTTGSNGAGSNGTRSNGTGSNGLGARSSNGPRNSGEQQDYAADVEVLIPTEPLSGAPAIRFDDTEDHHNRNHHNQSQASQYQVKQSQADQDEEAQNTQAPIAARHHYSAPEQTIASAEPILSANGMLTLESTVVESTVIGSLTDSLVYLTAKRALDIGMSAVLLIVLSPVLLFSAILVKLTDGGAVFYPHTRVGEGGNEFSCYKFRSMVMNADKMKAKLAFFNSHDDDRSFKIPDDPRVTKVGRWMRRTSIDELPQLWNVLKGDMSMVGPRPPLVTEVEQYTWDDMQRLAVKPGLTCTWQVSGRSRIPFPEQLQMDLAYIENRSLALDLKLIALTLPAVLSADGAY